MNFENEDNFQKRSYEQDFITNKLLLTFTFVFVGIFSVMYLNNKANYGSGYSFAMNCIMTIKYINITGFAFACIKWLLEIKNKTITKFRYTSGKNLFFVFGVSLICSLLIDNSSIFTAPKYIYTFLTIVAVQYFILVSYSKQVYLFAVSNIINICLLYLIGSANRLYYPMVALSIILAVAFLVVLLKAKSNNGEFLKIKMFEDGGKLLILNCVAIMLVNILSAVLMSVFAINAGVILGGIYILVVVFYNTIKIL